MKHLMFTLLFLSSIFNGFSQSAEGRYASRLTPDGSIFFIMPHKLGKLENVKKFQYDMTLLSWTDSITVNFTFLSKDMGIPATLAIGNVNEKFQCTEFSLLYMDIKKKNYEIRVSSKFAVADLKKLFESESPMTFYFKQGGLECMASYKESAWRRDRKKLNDIYQLYLYSK